MHRMVAQIRVFGAVCRHSKQSGVPMNVKSAASARRAETLEFLQSMLGQLRTMAQAERCDALAYFIEMAYIEASDVIRGDRPSDARSYKRYNAA